MDIEWSTILRLAPALLVILFMIKKNKRKEKPPATRVRRAKTNEPEFKRDYEPIEPS
jgi:hypothetical protein